MATPGTFTAYPSARLRGRLRRLLAVSALIATALLVGGIEVSVMTPPSSAELGDQSGALVDSGLVPGLSTGTSTTTREPDGSMSVTAYAAPVNYKDADGVWQPIDNTLVDAAGAVYDVENAANSFTAEIPEDPSSTPIRFSDDGAWVTMQMGGLADEPADVDDDTATFNHVARADEVAYRVTNTGLKESITLDAVPTAAVSYTYVIDASTGLIPSLAPDGGISFAQAEDEPVFEIPAGVMYDSSPDGSISSAVSYALHPDGGQWRLTVTPDLGWLTDTARVFPITIDPTITNQPDVRDCNLRSGSPDALGCGQNNYYLKVGRSDASHKNRAVLSFDLSNIPNAAVVTDAAVHLNLDSSVTTDTTKSADYAMYQAGKKFDGNATWNTSGANGSWTGGSPGATAYATKNDWNGSAPGDKTFSGLNDVVQSWVTNPATNTGLVLKQVGENVDTIIGFYSDASANPTAKMPFINVDYLYDAAANTSNTGDAGIDDGPEDASVDADPSIAMKIDEADWVENQLAADEDSTVMRRSCPPDVVTCPKVDYKYLNITVHREGAGNPCTPGATGCSNSGHKYYTCSAAATRNMVGYMTGTDKDELWFEQQLELSPSEGLLGIKRIRTLLNQNYPNYGKWHKEVPSSARNYQAGVIADVESGQPVIQNVRTGYLPFFGTKSLAHYDVAYGYDRSAKTVAIAEEWDSVYTFGYLSKDYNGKNPYGLKPDVPRSAAYNAVHYSTNSAYIQ